MKLHFEPNVDQQIKMEAVRQSCPTPRVVIFLFGESKPTRNNVCTFGRILSKGPRRVAHCRRGLDRRERTGACVSDFARSSL